MPSETIPKTENNLKAMILCAGLGTRLRPITNRIPKPAVPLFGLPVADFAFMIIEKAGINRAVLNLHHLPEAIRETFGDFHRGTTVEYIHEPEILGAVGGVKNAVELLDSDPIVVVNGDIAAEVDLSAMLARHNESGAALTIAVGEIESRPELRVIGIGADSEVKNIRKIVTGSGAVERRVVNLGVFIYSRAALEKYAPPAGMVFGFADGIVPRIAESGEKIAAYISDGYWNDIGEPASLLDFHFDALSGCSTSGCLERIAKTNHAVEYGFNAEKIYIGTNVKIGEGARIGDYSVIGDSTRIGAGSTIERCVALPGSVVAPGEGILDSIVFDNVIIKRDFHQ